MSETSAELSAIQHLDRLRAVLRAIADLARVCPRPTGEPELCRCLLDIEGMARAAVSETPTHAKVES